MREKCFNLSFYFKCSSYNSSVQSIGCLKHNTNQSYVFMAGDEAESDDHDWLRHCEEHVVVTVKQDEIEKLVAWSLVLVMLWRKDSCLIGWELRNVQCARSLMAIAYSIQPLSNRGAYAQMAELKSIVAKKVQELLLSLWKNIVDFFC